MEFLRKYGVATHIYIPMVKRAVVDHAVGADWTPAAGDVKISKDGGAAANVTNLPTAIAMGNSAVWDFSLTATEMQAAKHAITIADSATKAVEDNAFNILTFGHASAEIVQDLSASVAQTGDSYARLGAPAGASQAADIASIKVDTGTTIPGRIPAALAADGSIKASVQSFLGTAFTEGAAGRIAAAFKQFFNIATPASTMDAIVAVGTLTTYTGNTPQTGDAFARLGAPAGASTAADIAAVKSDTGGLVTKFGGITLLKHWLGMLAGKQAADATALTEIKASGAGSGTYDPTTDSLEANRDNLGTNGAALVLAKTTNLTGLNDLSAATVKTQVTDALNVDTYVEPGQGAPAATTSLAAKINYLYKAWRNKKTSTASQQSLYADDATTIDQKATQSDDGTTATVGEQASGP